MSTEYGAVHRVCEHASVAASNFNGPCLSRNLRRHAASYTYVGKEGHEERGTLHVSAVSRSGGTGTVVAAATCLYDQRVSPFTPCRAASMQGSRSKGETDRLGDRQASPARLRTAFVIIILTTARLDRSSGTELAGNRIMSSRLVATLDR